MATATDAKRGDTLAPLPTPEPPTPADLLLAEPLFPAEAYGQLF